MKHKGKLTWLNDFIKKESYAPFVVEKDEDYYKELRKKYKMILDATVEAGADEKSIKIIKKYSELQWKYF